jgi:hypothetical protein
MPKKLVNLEEGTVTFSFEDGSSQVFDLSKAENVLRNLALHGASQKIGDSYAGAGDESDPLAYAKAAVADMIGRLYSGDWRQAASGGAKRASLLVLAFAEASGRTVDEATEVVEGLGDDEKKALNAKPKIKAIIARIKAERAAAAAEKAAKAAEAAGE